MKSKNYFLLVILVFLLGCKKENPAVVETSAINIINAVINGGAIKVNPAALPNFSYNASADQVAFGTGKLYVQTPGPGKFIVVSAVDTNKVLFDGDLGLHAPMNTLYLSGQSPTVDTMFKVETDIPYINKGAVVPDSSINIRFVNLSPNSVPVNVNIRFSASNEVAGLGYKGIGEFKNYPAKITTGNYIFEVRNAATNALLVTYSFNTATNRFKTVALVLKGLMGTTSGTNALGLSLVTYYN